MRRIKRVLLALIFIICFWIMPSFAAEIEDTTLVGGRTTYQIRFADPSVTWNFKTVTFETVAAETYTGTAVTNPSYDVSDTGMTLVTEVANLKYNGNGSFDVFPKQGGTLTVKVTVKDEIFDGAIQDGHEVIAKYTQNFKITINPYLTYDIRYVSSSGKVLSTTTNKEVYNGTKYWTPTEINGYTSPSGKNIVYDNLNKQTIDFIYTPIQYTITYNLNGGSISGQKTKYTIEDGRYTLPTPTRTGYTFTGWIGSNGSTAQTNVTISAGSMGNKTYTANWEAIYYYLDVNHTLNGSAISNSSSEGVGSFDMYISGSLASNDIGDYYARHQYGTSYSIADIKPAAGYSHSSTSGSLSGNITNTTVVTLNWSTINYSITYNLNGGSISNNLTSYNVRTNSFTLPTPSRSGYIFTGWTGTNLSSPTMSVTISKGSTGNRSYTANWKLAQYVLLDSSVDNTGGFSSTYSGTGSSSNPSQNRSGTAYYWYGTKNAEYNGPGRTSSMNYLINNPSFLSQFSTVEITYSYDSYSGQNGYGGYAWAGVGSSQYSPRVKGYDWSLRNSSRSGTISISLTSSDKYIIFGTGASNNDNARVTHKVTKIVLKN